MLSSQRVPTRVALVAGILWIAADSVAQADDETAFVQHVAPLLEQRCVGCHHAPSPKGGLDLTRRSGLLKGGDSGPAVVPGEPDESLLVDLVEGPEPAMPKDGDPLSDEQVEAMREWVRQGAHWPPGLALKVADSDWWSLRPLVSPSLPAMAADDAAWARSPIDVFAIAKMREHGLAPSPEADRRTLIRRLAFDLHGLPPTPREVEAFLTDHAPDAYEKLVDRLLDSPRYGERWARHWLDVVHYGDTHGYDKDKRRPNAWPYRDYVIRALNADRPYACFVREQVAGDVVDPGDPDGVIATGFLVAGPWDYVGHVELREGTVDKQITRNLDRDDIVTNTLSTFASLTVGCARCHDHKFDPITQADYYGLQAVFAGIERAERPYRIDPGVDAERRRLTSALRELEAAVQHDPSGSRDQTPRAPESTLDGASGDQPPTTPRAQGDARIAELKKQIEGLSKPPMVFAAASTFEPQSNFTPPPDGKPRPIHLLQRGSVSSPGPLMAPGAVACLDDLPSQFDLENPDDEGQRRAALARWLTDPRNPLTRRSIVNRVWQYHFGRGLVDSPNDFGRMGSLPTHPELLDWLAAEFRDGRQSLKELHRLIVTSSVYRQTSVENAANATIDAGNRFLWRANRRRLEAEAVRDAVLAVSGQLELTMYGPGFDLFGFVDDHSPHYLYADHDVDDPKTRRRTVYRFIVRSVPDPLMEVLDCADPSINVPTRNTTITALQALSLLNNRFMTRQAEHFAARVDGHGGDVTQRIEYAYQLALGRSPDGEESAMLVDYVNKHGMANLCRLILNTNEFLFID